MLVGLLALLTLLFALLHALAGLLLFLLALGLALLELLLALLGGLLASLGLGLGLLALCHTCFALFQFASLLEVFQRDLFRLHEHRVHVHFGRGGGVDCRGLGRRSVGG